MLAFSLKLPKKLNEQATLEERLGARACCCLKTLASSSLRCLGYWIIDKWEWLETLPPTGKNLKTYPKHQIHQRRQGIDLKDLNGNVWAVFLKCFHFLNGKTLEDLKLLGFPCHKIGGFSALFGEKKLLDFFFGNTLALGTLPSFLWPHSFLEGSFKQKPSFPRYTYGLL